MFCSGFKATNLVHIYLTRKTVRIFESRLEIAINYIRKYFEICVS
jgi:intergrase/recombinase